MMNSKKAITILIAICLIMFSGINALADDEITANPKQIFSFTGIKDIDTETEAWVSVSSTLDTLTSFDPGTEIVLTAEIHNASDNEHYTYQWQYSNDHGATFIDVEDANDATYTYSIDETNYKNIWRVLVEVYQVDESEEKSDSSTVE